MEKVYKNKAVFLCWKSYQIPLNLGSFAVVYGLGSITERLATMRARARGTAEFDESRALIWNVKPIFNHGLIFFL